MRWTGRTDLHCCADVSMYIAQQYLYVVRTRTQTAHASVSVHTAVVVRARELICLLWCLRYTRCQYSCVTYLVPGVPVSCCSTWYLVYRFHFAVHVTKCRSFNNFFANCRHFASLTRSNQRNGSHERALISLVEDSSVYAVLL